MSKDGTVQVIGEFDRRMMSGYGECVVREEGKLSRYVGLFCENRFVEGTIIEVRRPEKEGEDEYDLIEERLFPRKLTNG